MKTALIYIYSGLIVIKSMVDLFKIRRLSTSMPYSEKSKRIFRTPKKISRDVIKKTGSTVETTGMEKLPEGPVLFVANHQGIFDILVLLGYVGKPVGFIAKKEIKKIPIIAKWMVELGCVFIDRSNRRAAIKVIDDGVASLKQGQSMVIFPEGTRSRSSQVGIFKAGSLRLATRANVPIVPVMIDGTYKMLESNDGKIKGAHVYLEICAPIYPEHYQNKKHNQLAVDIQTQIETAINQKITA